jgi:hypothetical protein
MPASGNAISAFAVWAMIIGWTPPSVRMASAALMRAASIAFWRTVIGCVPSGLGKSRGMQFLHPPRCAAKAENGPDHADGLHCI